MNKGSDPVYFAERLKAEREAAMAATSDQARASHLELAEQYQQLLEAFGRPKLVNGEAGSAELQPKAEA